MCLLWSFFSSKNIYKINENTDFSQEKTLHQHHNWSHPKGVFNGSGYLGLLINIQKSVLNLKWTFGIFRCGSKFSRHDIESSKSEKFENSAAMEKDSESTINLNQNIKPINWQLFHCNIGLCKASKFIKFKKYYQRILWSKK